MPTTLKYADDTKIVAVAPMMGWTNRQCRYFHRQISSDSLLYTEMVVADAVIHGPRERLLSFDAAEHPIALQLGGSDPTKLAEAARISEGFGYDEINLNVGCPSDRVQSSTFGVCLMKTPELVAECVSAMKAVVNVPVTVKCRIGVDHQDPETALDTIADAVFTVGTDALWVHSRKAWLRGLSPKENREIPPLDYDLVYRLKTRYQDKFIGINGGIHTLGESRNHLDKVDGVMLGRTAYNKPSVLGGVDALLRGKEAEDIDCIALIEAMVDYADRHIAADGRLDHVTRHMIGLFHGLSGARRYRQILSTDAHRLGASAEILRNAFEAVDLDSRQPSGLTLLESSGRDGHRDPAAGQ